LYYTADISVRCLPQGLPMPGAGIAYAWHKNHWAHVTSRCEVDELR